MALLGTGHPVHDLWRLCGYAICLERKAAGKADRSSGCTK